MAIIVFCAWCDKVIGKTGTENDSGVSDGICDDCKAKLTPANIQQVTVSDIDFEALDREVERRLAKQTEGQS